MHVTRIHEDPRVTNLITKDSGAVCVKSATRSTLSLRLVM